MGSTLVLLTCLWSENTFKDKQNQYPRVRQARGNSIKAIDSLFKELNIEYPPRKVLISAFKKEQILELWAMTETLNTFTLVKTYAFTAFSGALGPKRKQGDMQIPEGFYRLVHFNPWSEFHLSLRINYPNKSDSILGEKGNLGGQILIHGKAVTIGCIPIGDSAIEELYIICVDTKSKGQKDIPVYIFPCQMDTSGMIVLKDIAGSDSVLLSFWQNLKQGYDTFEATHKQLKFLINDRGKYVFENN